MEELVNFNVATLAQYFGVGCPPAGYGSAVGI